VPSFSDQFLDETIRLWQPRVGHRLSREEARQMAGNLAGFFQLLADWDVLSWVTHALRESHRDQKQFQDEQIAKLQRDHRRIQDRIDAMYLDKLDGRIDATFFL
jgi:hypothetical protein